MSDNARDRLTVMNLSGAAARGELSGSRPAGVGSGGRLTRAMWEREMRRLRFFARLLATVTGALVLRIAVSGLTFATGFSLVIVVVLLIGALLLLRQGHRIEPPSAPSPH
jgi:hypothetical protein